MFRFFSLTSFIVMFTFNFVATQSLSSEIYHFLISSRNSLHILEWDGQQASIRQLSTSSLQDLTIIYADATHDGRILLVALFDFGINLALFNQDGEFVRYLTELNPPAPTWQSFDITPDNQYIVVDNEYLRGIVLGDLNNFELDTPIQQFTSLVYGARPSISYDGRFIVYDEGLGNDEFSIMLIDLGSEKIYKQGSEIRITSDLQERCTYPDFHPTTYKIIYTCIPDTGLIAPSIFITDISNGETISLNEDKFSSCVRWSPNGEKLAFNSRDTIYILTLETMQLEEIQVDLNLLSDEALPICPVWLNW